jgi:hypothetical protein
MFIRNGSKFFNLDRAVTGEAVESRGGERVRLFNERNDVLGIVDPADLIERETVLIAGPVSVVFIDDDGTVTWASVIAWRLAPHSSTGEPVFAESPPRGHMFMVTKDNAVIGLGGRMFKNLEAAVKAIQAAASLATLEVQ